MNVEQVRKFVLRLLLAATCSSTAAIGLAAGVPLHDGLLSYWSLNDGQGSVAHDTAYLLQSAGVIADNGQVRNGPTWLNSDNGGIFNAGLRFNGTNQDVLIPNSADMNVNASAVTLSAWVKLDQFPSQISGSFSGILDSSADNYVLYLDKTNDELRFKVTTVGGAAARPGIPADMLNTTSWLHVMGVYDGTRASIYYNGNLVSSLAAAGLTGAVLPGQVGSIGAQPNASPPHAATSLFKGNIADVALWNRPLGLAEAQYLYNEGVGRSVGSANPSIEPIAPTPPPANPSIYVAAHRGYSVMAPENTLSAFSAAKGFADRVEFDVQVSKDGKLVVMHDGTVNRTTNGAGSVSSLNYAGYIDGLDAGSWFSPAFVGEPVPTMRQSIETISTNGMTPLIERKTGTAAAYVNELTEMGVLDDVVIIAFDWNFLAQVRALAPDVQLGALGSGTLNASVIADIAGRGIDFVNWGDGGGVNAANIDLTHAAGMEFHVWTVNNTGRMQQLIDLGVDGITTDDPEALRSLVPWPAPGDFNGDGLVDAADLELWKVGFGIGIAEGAKRADGDANGDGAVDGADFLAWQRQFTGGSSTAAMGAVPEPSTTALACLAGVGLVASRGRRQSPARSKNQPPRTIKDMLRREISTAPARRWTRRISY